ncbi:MAG: GYF domain-containing protein [Janthinobacterium lividum]
MMMYRISRNGQVFGPYSEAEVRQYLVSGNIAVTDYAQLAGTVDWVPVLQLFPLPAMPGQAQGAMSASAPLRLYPDPPDFPWWAVLLLAMITGGLFIVVWDIVQAAWLRRVQPASQALALYVGVAVVFLLRLPASWEAINFNLFGGPPVGPHHGFLLFLVWLGLFIASRRTVRQDLLQHFNGPEPIGLRLNSFFVYLFGGLYIQYHLNRINEIKRAMQVSVPAY